jgi:threonyl-tRNA synthetase
MSSKKTTPDNLEILRHSTAHVLAAAVLEMFPEAKHAIGPAIENGYYQDFDLPRTLIPEDLPILEEKMKKIIEANFPFEKEEIAAENALKHFQKASQIYKVELIKDIKSKNQELKTKNVSVYKTGSFIDLCSGPHLDSTGEINPETFKLTKISGAYWKGDEKNKMLQRVYGVVFENKKELDEYLKNLEEAEKRDHKKLGRELDLFTFHSEAPGSPFWHPKGMIIWNILENLGKTLRKKYGCQEIQTPILAKSVLWKTSGHWEHYKDDMFHFKVENDEYAIKPMDCPFDILLFQEKQRSYRELPIRYSEIGRVFRHEKSGELNGLFRVQHITQDDAHIFCAEDQVENEIATLIQTVKEYYAYFGIDPNFFFANRPENFMGKAESWDKAEKNLVNALKKEKIKYGLKDKDGAFYGPKIDININDVLGRSWQLATIQLDFQLPERFELEYVSNDGQKKRPVIIHAAIFGAFERFIGILTEHFAGAFPVWLSPVQTIIIPVSEKFKDYAKSVGAQFIEPGIRFEIDDSDESLGKRIRNAEKQKIPYILVVGEKEVSDNSVSVRSRNEKEQPVMKVEEFIENTKKEIGEKK